jgi:pimeloyl-ACP methyl ester carboxylesterase
MPVQSDRMDAAIPRGARVERRRAVAPDGTELTLTRLTQGPRALLMVPPAISLGRHWAAVAAGLEGDFSCWVLDRRGRGDSGDREPYGFEREYEDIAAVLASFDGAPVGVAAHSSGATVTLGAITRGAPAAWLALYEPPWPIDGPLSPLERIDAVEALIAAGDRDAALEKGFREVVGMPAAVVEALKGAPVWAEWRALAHTWPREMREVEKLPHGVEHLATITAPTVMLVGELTAGHMRRSTTAIAAALPAATVVELPGQGHGALVAAPGLVASIIRDFASQVQPGP